jgi:hypothetical protein
MIPEARRCVSTTILVALSLAGCAATSHDAPQPGEAQAAESPATTAASNSDPQSLAYGTPLLIERTDVRIGTTVQFHGRIPTPSEMHDLTLLPGYSRLVLSFDAWPAEFSRLQVLDQVPQGVEVVAVLPGWPPTLASVDAWNYLQIPVRAIVVVPGPPPSIDAVTSLNSMRALERVIAQMDEPSRAGFERLQRPLSFRKVVR